MVKQKICGSTNDCAELIVDYSNSKDPKLEIKGVPFETTFNRLKSASGEWFKVLILPLFAAMAIEFAFANGVHFKVLLLAFGSIWMMLTSCHLNKKVDLKVRRWFVKRTGNKKKNKATFSEIKSQELILFNINNTVVEYDTDGDVERQLKKIWVKQEHPSSILRNQANIKDLLLLKNDPIWNAYFIFKKIPKNGHLYVEWI